MLNMMIRYHRIKVINSFSQLTQTSTRQMPKSFDAHQFTLTLSRNRFLTIHSIPQSDRFKPVGLRKNKYSDNQVVSFSRRFIMEKIKLAEIRQQITKTAQTCQIATFPHNVLPTNSNWLPIAVAPNQPPCIRP